MNILETYLRYGVRSRLAERLSMLRLPVSTFRNTSNNNLRERYDLSAAVIKEVKKCIKREPINEQIILKLLQNCNFVCCCCKKNDTGFIVHHIEEYSKTQNNNYDNLIVLCPNHHDLAHRNSGLTFRLTPDILRKTKSKWEREVHENKTEVLTKSNTIQTFSKRESIFSVNSKFNILLLDFARLDRDEGREIESTICRRILQKIEEENLEIDIIFKSDIEIPKTFDEGRSIGADLMADLVIWGEIYDESKEGELLYTISSHKELSIPSNRRTGIHYISSMSEIKQGYLQHDIDFVIYWALAVSAFHLNNSEHVVLHALNALEIYPDNLNCYFVLGQGLDMEGDFELAINTFLTCIELGANGPDIYNNLGLSYLHNSNLEEAINNLEKAFNLAPFSDVVIHNLGIWHCKKQNYDLAIAYLTKGFELNPNSSSILNSIGGVYYEKGDVKKALRYFDKGFKINSKDPAILNSLGICNLDLGNLNIAESYFTDSIAHSVNPCIPLNNLGLLKKKEGKTIEALDQFSKAIQCSRSYSTPYKNLMSMTFDLKYYDIVLHFYKILKKVGNVDYESKYMAGISYSMEGLKEEAMNVFNELLKEEEEAAVHYSIGLLYLEVGKLELAIKHFRIIVELDPKDSGGYYNLTLAYLKSENLKLAEESISKFNDLDNSSYESYLLNAKYWKGNGDHKKAKELYEKACVIEPRIRTNELDVIFKLN